MKTEETSEKSATKPKTKSERKLRIQLTQQEVIRWHNRRVEKKHRVLAENSVAVEQRIPENSVAVAQRIPEADRIVSLTELSETVRTKVFQTLGPNTNLEDLLRHRAKLRHQSQSVISILQDERLLLIRRVEQIDATIDLLDRSC